MKILNIYFKNINSLEGESRIHFDQSPIADGGVFAITGPNGSGKSTVLDVITLGLYGETYRFDRPAEHVMTKSKTESFAQVEFALGDEQFRSSWQVKRKDNNAASELLAPEMTLVQLNGSEQVLEQSAQKVREKMVELTGMDFHKFTKSMVLAQGDFAAFLNALDSERMDILEKISGTDVYDEYKNQAVEKNAQAQDKLELLERDLNAIPVMDEGSREAAEQDLMDFQQQQAELEDEQQAVQQQLAWVHKKTDLEDQVESLHSKQQQTEKELEENQKILENIAEAPDVTAIQQEMVAVDNKVEQVQQGKKTLDSYRDELERLQKQLGPDVLADDALNIDNGTTPEQQKINIDEINQKYTKLNSELPKEADLLQRFNQQLEEKKSALITTSRWLEEHGTDKSLLDSFPETTKLRNVRVELAELSGKQQGYTDWLVNIDTQLAEKQVSIESLKQKNTEILAQIKEEEQVLDDLAEGHSLQDLLEMKQDQQERIDDFVEMCDLATVNSKLGKKGLFSYFFTKDEHKEEEHLKEEAEQLDIEIGLEANIVKTLEQALSNENLLQKMQPEREHLVDGKPCPLCGALEHPYATNAPASAIVNTKQALADQKKKVKVLTTNAENLNKQIVRLQKQNNINDQKDSKLEVIQSQWNRLANKLNTASLDLEIDNLSLMKELLKNEKKDLINISKLVKKYTKQQNAIIETRSIIETNEVTIARLSKELDALELEKNTRPDDAANQNEVYQQYLKQEQELANEILGQLEKLGENVPEPGEENALINRLTARKQEYQHITMQNQALSQEIPALENNIKASTGKVEQMTQQIEQYKKQVQQQETAGLHLSLVEKQKLIAEKEKVLAEQEADLSQMKQDLSKKTSESGQAGLKELEQTIALKQRQPELQQKQQQLTETVSNIKNELGKLQQQLEQEQAKQESSIALDQLQQQQKSINDKLDIAKQEATSLQNKLDKQDALKAKYEELVDKVESQKLEAEALKADAQLVADENSTGFRKKVQQVMTDRLLSQANQVLEKISGRYFVRKVESEHGLALEIEDTKQHNARRLPKTLSGGESFIVSLSLALGLAEMANDSHAINSLFLDEGFGNLDAESLYLAMTTLEGLKTHGKTVGVISHVEGVRKRIKTQIEMQKKPNGLSTLKMVS